MRRHLASGETPLRCATACGGCAVLPVCCFGPGFVPGFVAAGFTAAGAAFGVVAGAAGLFGEAPVAPGAASFAAFGVVPSGLGGGNVGRRSARMSAALTGPAVSGCALRSSTCVITS